MKTYWKLLRFFSLLTFFPLLLNAQNSSNDQWSLTVGGKTVKSNSDGSFSIPNVSAPDRVGPDGNIPADFISDDAIRVNAIINKGGTIYRATSGFFRIQQSQIKNVGELQFEPEDLRRSPKRLRAQSDDSTLTYAGHTTQVRVTATLPDGSTKDVTPESENTSYRSSNLDVAIVNPDGVVTAGTRSGEAIITASNEGASSTVRIIVALGDPFTEVSGIVMDENGIPVSNVAVKILELVGFESMTQDNGSFSIIAVPTVIVSSYTLIVVTRPPFNVPVFGFAVSVVPVPGGITDSGIITMNSLTITDSDNDGVVDQIESVLGFNPNDADTDNDGILDSAEDQDTDGLPDFAEFLVGSDPNVVDTDGDGTNDPNEDYDIDGVVDSQEVSLGLNLFNPDSDSDFYLDGLEMELGSDALDPSSIPTTLVSASPVSNVAILGFPESINIQSVYSSPQLKVSVIDIASDSPGTIMSTPFITLLIADEKIIDRGTSYASPSIGISVADFDAAEVQNGTTKGAPILSVQVTP